MNPENSVTIAELSEPGYYQQVESLLEKTLVSAVYRKFPPVVFLDDRAPAEIIYYLYTVAPEHDVTRGGEARLEHGEAAVRRLCLFDEYLGRNRARIRDEIFKGSRQLAEKLLRAAMSFDHESVYVDEHDSL